MGWYIVIGLIVLYFIHYFIWKAKKKRQITRIRNRLLLIKGPHWAGPSPFITNIIFSLNIKPRVLPESLMVYVAKTKNTDDWETDIQIKEAFDMDIQNIIAMLDSIEDSLFFYYNLRFAKAIAPLYELCLKLKRKGA